MAQKEVLIALVQEIAKVLHKIKKQTDLDQPENASQGRMEFAYVQYYLVEMLNLLDLSIYLLTHRIFRKYLNFPTRQIMEITLYLEDVYSVKKAEGQDAVHRLFFKDMATVTKSLLALPGEGGKERLENQLGLLDIASSILSLGFKTEDVSPKARRNMSDLCDKSTIVVKNTTGSELYKTYSVLSASSHANVVNIGASNSTNDEAEALMIFEIGVELAIRFCEMVVKESNYSELNPDVENLKRIAWGR